jgi:3-methylcrotonyl-CoA carboxylase alpha subunit
MIRSLLIANRGEIACRIIRTCRRLGIRAIVVYSDADRDSLHVRQADQAIRIGPAPAAESYLDVARILKACREAKADAIHPGYGFLSEKPELPERCAEAGVVFVGPSADRVRVMGSKIGAKAIAGTAGLACVPGYAGADQATDRLVSEAERVGYPIMIKASAGGGGKGMRRVMARKDFVGAADLARREAEAAFGDPSLLLEKLVLRPRHLEVQVAGDKHGNLVHLFERDCSIQRNHQKLIEEAPAPNLPGEIRDRLLASAVTLARAIAYDNLGTVEFIYENGQAEPWFLEMNTRLQVEHPVTEMITGLDLVEWQIRIAGGEPLPLSQEQIVATGCAIEARVTAERADRNFQPAAGRLYVVREPSGMRVDSGITDGSEVASAYDSLLAKVVSHGATRAVAAAKLANALRDFVMLGPPTIAAFLADAIEKPAFADGLATTAFIAENFPEGWAPQRHNAELARAIAAAIGAERARPPLRVAEGASPWSRLIGFRLLGPAGGRAAASLTLAEDEHEWTIRLESQADGLLAAQGAGDALRFRLDMDDESFVVSREGIRLRGVYAVEAGRLWLWLAGETYAFDVATEVSRAAAAHKAGRSDGAVVAAVPGVLSEVKVAVGDLVSEGQIVAVLESMKLFMPVSAPAAGRVAEIRYRAGEGVAAGDLLMTIVQEPLETDGRP